jgi:peptide/nickel transport system substrate-binding protein
MEKLEQLAATLRDGRIGRREFLRRAVALGLSVPAAGALLAACGGGDDEAAAPSATAPAGEPKAGGVLRVGLSDNFTDFDPHHEPFGNFPFINQLYGAPFRDANQPDASAPEPWLATELRFSDDFTSVDIILREGVTFHGGGALDAEAMIATLNKVRDPVGGRDQAAAWEPIVKDVEAVDASTARVTFNDPTPDALVRQLMSRLNVISPALIEEGEEALLTKEDGTGAFTLVRYEQGNVAVMDRYAEFWNKPLPYLDSIEFRFFSDPDAMTAALESGEVDLVQSLPPQNVPRLKDSFQIVPGPAGTTFEVISSAMPGRPFERKEARQALQFLINRERFATEIMFGTGEVAYVHVDTNSIGYDPSFAERYTYDPQQAKERFEALGMLGQDPIEILQLAGTLPLIGRLAEMVAGDMNAIGLNAKLVPLDLSVWGERFFGSDKGNYDMLCSFMGRSNRYPSLPAVGNIGLNPLDNPLFPDNKPPAKYTEAFLALGKALTAEEQKKWALQQEETVLDESWDIAVAYQKTQYAMRQDIQGFGISRDDWMILDGISFT